MKIIVQKHSFSLIELVIQTELCTKGSIYRLLACNSFNRSLFPIILNGIMSVKRHFIDTYLIGLVFVLGAARIMPTNVSAINTYVAPTKSV